MYSMTGVWSVGPSVPGQGASWIFRDFPILVELVFYEETKEYKLECQGLRIKNRVLSAKTEIEAKNLATRVLRHELEQMLEMIPLLPGEGQSDSTDGLRHSEEDGSSSKLQRPRQKQVVESQLPDPPGYDAFDI
jgi:hypothetical protein